MDEIENPLSFPKKIDMPRLQGYDYSDQLYFGEHFEGYSIKGEADFSKSYSRLRYVVANFLGLSSRIVAGFLFGEPLSIDFKDQANQDFVDALIADNHLFTELYESALANARRGDSVFKIRIGQRNPSNVSDPKTIIIEEQNPNIYFPLFDPQNAKDVPKQEVLAWIFKVGNNSYLHKEIHISGYIFHEIYSYNPDSRLIMSQESSEAFGFPAQEETGVDRPLVFHVPNVRDGRGYFGTSDYKDLDNLQFALNNRLTKIDNILDKHSDPILAVPPGVLDENGKVKKEALGMFEVANDNPGFNKPEYIVWNANLDAAFKEIDALVESLFMYSEISPATLGMDKNGIAESGRALKLRLLATLRKVNRKRIYYDQTIKDILETALDLAVAHNITIGGKAPGKKDERPTLNWPDGIPTDTVEQVTEEVQRIDAGLSDVADSLVRLDGLTPADAKKKAAEIEAANRINLPSTGAVPGGPKAGNMPGGTPGAMPGQMPMGGKMPMKGG